MTVNISNILYRGNCKEQEGLKEAILKEIPEAQVEFVEGEDGEKNLLNWHQFWLLIMLLLPV